MTQILVEPPVLRSTSAEIRQKTAQIRQALQSVDQAIYSVDLAVFEGNRAASVRSRYNGLRNRILNWPALLEQFSADLENAANLFEKADKNGLGQDTPKKKTRIYLINGINFTMRDTDGKNGPDGLEGPNDLLKNLKKEYGDDVDVVIVGAHPYSTDFAQFQVKGTNYGDWRSPIDWITGSIAQDANEKISKIAPIINTAWGYGQVVNEYITGGSDQSQIVYDWIKKDLQNNGLAGENVMLIGVSGGGLIASNIADRIEDNLNVNVSGVFSMGSPYINRASSAELQLDIRNQDDVIGYLGVTGLNDFMHHVYEKGLSGLPDSLDLLGAHGSYWNSNEVVNYVGPALAL